MDEPIRARIVTAVVVIILCCTGFGLRVMFQKVDVAPRDTQETPSDRNLSLRRMLTIFDFRSLLASSQRTLSLSGLILIGCYTGPTLAGSLAFGKEATGETDE